MPKTNKIKLTVGRVSEVVEPKTGQTFLWDSETPGLAVRATPGSRSYIFQRKLGGRTVRTTIGDVRAWPLPQAREEARRLQRLIDHGIDPRSEKIELKASQEREGLLVRALWLKYIDSHPRKKNFPNRKDAWSDRHRQDHLYQGERVLLTLLEKKIVDIDAKAVLKWADDSLGKGRNTAVRQGFLKFRAMWRWAYGRGEFGALADPAMFSIKDLTNRIPRAGLKDDVLQLSQLRDWFGAVTMIENRVISAFLQGLLLTGARRNELAALKWADIDFKLKGIHLHDKIEVGGRMVPLTPYCEFLISSLPRRNEFVFSSNSASGHLEEPRIAHKKALLVAGLSRDLSLHGLRRTFATVAQELEEMPAGVAAQLMGHRPSATAEKHYIKRSLDFLKKWHGRLEEMILKEAGITFDVEASQEGLHVV